MLDDLIAALGTKLELTAEDIADIFWLTHFQQQLSIEAESNPPTPDPVPVVKDEVSSVVSEDGYQQPPQAGDQAIPSDNANPPPKPPEIGVKPRQPHQPEAKPLSQDSDRSIKVPNAPSIRDPLALMKALRPLIRQVPSGVATVLDETATATQIAEAQIWLPRTKPVLEPWLELELVVDESTSMLIWRRTVLELQNLFKHYGAFRDIHVWGLVVDPAQNSKLYLRAGIGAGAKRRSLRSPQELIDPTGRRLILVVTDCLSSIWWDKTAIPTLESWANRGPVALLQMLPERLWARTALRQASAVALYGMEPGVANQNLVAVESPVWNEEDAAKRKPERVLKLPVLSLEPELASLWSQMVSGRGSVASAGFLLRAEPESPTRTLPSTEPSSTELPSTELPSPEQRVFLFRSVSSIMARQLASLLAASPVISLPVIRLIQETLLPQSNQVHVAEVLLGGLFVLTATPDIETHPDDLEYRFIDERIRTLLLPFASVSDTVSVLSRYLVQKFGKSLDWFIANWQVLSQSEQQGAEEMRAFAVVAAEVLRQRGRQYFEFIQAVDARYGTGDGARESAIPQFLSLFPEDQGETLRAKIVEHYAPKQLLDQTKARALMFEIDTVGERITCSYTGYAVLRSLDLPPEEDAARKGITGETLFPKSKGFSGLNADIHNLLPAKGQVNIARGNKPFAEVPSDDVRVWYWADRESTSAPSLPLADCAKLGERGFEPRDAAKGRVARSMFYVYTIYHDRVNKRYFEPQQETLRKWHQQYPPTTAEMERSRRVANSAQGNTNPFVLDPTLIDRMYPPAPSPESEREPVWQMFEFDMAVVVELQTAEAEVATIVFDSASDDSASDDFASELQPFNFVVATVEVELGRDRDSRDNLFTRIRHEPNLEAKITLIDAAIYAETNQYLSDLQKTILRGSWQNKTYKKISDESNYGEGYIKNIGLELWQLVSKVIGGRITKMTFRSLLSLSQASEQSQLRIERQQQQAQQWIEGMGDGVTLEMVAIPAGRFTMGSPEQETDSSNSERPQHTVTLQSFLIGKYPVTQAQWRAVATLPQINRDLNPAPSRFKGGDRPVERVSWYEAVEFCDRLSQKTGKPYRLPSEAEWEYACRAGTTTPFHFGATITTELANYNGNSTYGFAPKGVYQGVYRGKTTPVGRFGVANGFGLYDMHGNVWEWCADHWHENYEGAPEDSSAWLSKNDNALRLLRGGSWFDDSGLCRSALRHRYNPSLRDGYSGFRLACSYPAGRLTPMARTL